MRNDDNENLKELLSELFDVTEAAEAMSDINAGDAIIAGSPSPMPDEAIVRGIKKQVRNRLWLSKRRRFVRRTSEAAVAAVLVIGVLIGLVITQSRHDSSAALNLNIWGEATLEVIETDPEYVLLIGEIEEIEASLLTIRLDEDSVENDDLFEIEMEMLEMEGNFWEG